MQREVGRLRQGFPGAIPRERRQALQPEGFAAFMRAHGASVLDGMTLQIFQRILALALRDGGIWGAAETGMELPKLYRRAAEHLRLDSRTEIDESLRKVLGACATIVDGVAHLGNRLSDAHGKDRRSAKPAKRHADFVVLIAAAMTGLQLSTLDALRAL